MAKNEAQYRARQRFCKMPSRATDADAGFDDDYDISRRHYLLDIDDTRTCRANDIAGDSAKAGRKRAARSASTRSRRHYDR